MEEGLGSHSSIANWVLGQRVSLLSIGAEFVDDDWRSERQSVCDSCEYKAKVRPDGILPEVDGCGKCKCPFDPKVGILSHYRRSGQEDDKLTKTEMAQIVAMRKFFPSLFVRSYIRCPHEDGNKWEAIDKKHKKLKK